MAGERSGSGVWIGVAMVVAVATGLIGTAGVFFRSSGGSGGGGGREMAKAAGEAAAKAEAAAGEARARAEEAAAAARGAEESAASLAARVAALEAASERPAPGPADSGGRGMGDGPVAGRGDGAGKPDAALVAEYQALRKKVFRDQATADEQKRFFEILKGPGFIDGLLADLEAKVAAAPGDPDARLGLADAYISKLFTVPAGPEMGVWGGKAEEQWKEILKQDDRHWQARYSLAFSWSQYPD